MRGSGCTPTPAPGYKAPTASTGSGTLVPPAGYKAADTHTVTTRTQTYAQSTRNETWYLRRKTPTSARTTPQASENATEAHLE